MWGDDLALVGLVDPQPEAGIAVGPVLSLWSDPIDEVSLHLAECYECRRGFLANARCAGVSPGACSRKCGTSKGKGKGGGQCCSV